MKKGASLVLLFLIFGIFLVGSFGDVIATCGVVAGSSYFSDLVSVPTTCTTTGYCLMPNCYNANHGGYSSFQACASVCGGSCWGCPSGCGSNNVDCTCSSDCSNSCLLNCHASNSFPCTQTQTVYYCDSSCTRQCNPNTLGDCATSCCTPSIDASYYLNQNICGNDLSNGCTNSLNVNCLSGSCNYPFSDLDLSLSYRNFTGCSFTVGDASSPCFLFTNPTIRLANPWRGTNYFLNFTTFQNLSSITVS